MGRREVSQNFTGGEGLAARQLERQPLEESLELFEKGIKLSRECRARLTNAERRIEILMKDADGNLTAMDIEPDELR